MFNLPAYAYLFRIFFTMLNSSSFFAFLLTLCISTNLFATDRAFKYAVSKDEKKQNNKLIAHEHYQLSYNFEHAQAEWVFHSLNYLPDDFIFDRTNNFRQDPILKSMGPNRQDYLNSGYDRGHLAPSQDFAFSEEAVSDSFYYSNMSPQNSDFNQTGLWFKIENQIRRWSSVKSTQLFIFSGPVLTNKLKKLKPDSKVSLPNMFYKVILAKTQNGKYHAVGFLVPNLNILRDHMLYRVPVDHIEKVTGLDFFSELPDHLEEAVERSYDKKFWKK